MDSYSSGGSSSRENFKVKDAKGMLTTFVVMLILCFINYWLLTSVENFTDIFNILQVAALILLLMSIFRFKAILPGVEFDFESGKLSFPGGAIAANNFTDYFTPSFLLQFFKRYSIDIEEIAQIYTTFDYRFWDNEHRRRIYKLELSGSFGAAAVEFESEQKCDQLYAIIRSVNNMGTPVTRA